MNKEAKEEESKSGKRELEGEEEGVAVVGKRACFETSLWYEFGGGIG